MFPLWSALLDGSFVVLDVGPCSLFSHFLGALVILWFTRFHQCMTKLVEKEQYHSVKFDCGMVHPTFALNVVLFHKGVLRKPLFHKLPLIK